MIECPTRMLQHPELACSAAVLARGLVEAEDECAPGLALTVQAMTAVNEQRIGRKAIADLATGATALEWDAQ